MRFVLILLLGCSFGSKKKGEVSATISDEEKFWCRKNPGSNDPEQLAVFPFKKWDTSLKTFYEPHQEKGSSKKCVFEQTNQFTPRVGDNGVKLEDCKPCPGILSIFFNCWHHAD